MNDTVNEHAGSILRIQPQGQRRDPERKVTRRVAKTAQHGL
jgi:hypothetical protein